MHDNSLIAVTERLLFSEFYTGCLPPLGLFDKFAKQFHPATTTPTFAPANIVSVDLNPQVMKRTQQFPDHQSKFIYG
jgi:hypothetical protein